MVTPQNLLFSELKPGVAIKILYFLVLGTSRKIFIFSGACTKVNKRGGTFEVQNFHGREKVFINFIYRSPFIIRLEKLRSYNFDRQTKGSRVTREYKINDRNDSSLQFLLFTSSKLKKAMDAYDYLYNVVQNISERRRLRRKFRI
jgi:hypothetical protein